MIDGTTAAKLGWGLGVGLVVAGALIYVFFYLLFTKVPAVRQRRIDLHIW
jgi:uncharacterized BrkB/YihY/UPF0761 family membrane protein